MCGSLTNDSNYRRPWRAIGGAAGGSRDEASTAGLRVNGYQHCSLQILAKRHVGGTIHLKRGEALTRPIEIKPHVASLNHRFTFTDDWRECGENRSLDVKKLSRKSKFLNLYSMLYTIQLYRSYSQEANLRQSHNKSVLNRFAVKQEAYNFKLTSNSQ